MTAAACRLAWVAPGGPSARSLDDAFPEGQCESYSLADPERTAVPDGEIVARILTTPGDYDDTIQDLVSGKLTQCYARGLSLVRTGASDKEILATIATLLAAEDTKGLVGAVVLPASVIREVGGRANHTFCVYDTDTPSGAQHHADVVGTFDRVMTNSAWKREQPKRRYALRDEMRKFVVEATTPADLLAELRRAGI